MPPRRERPAPASRRGRDATARNHPATTTLTLGLTVHGVTSQPYLATRAATAGPDLVANVFPSRPSGGPPADLLALARAPGVTGHGGPYPVALPVLRARGHADGVIAVGRDQAPAPVDQPKVTRAAGYAAARWWLNAALRTRSGVTPVIQSP